MNNPPPQSDSSSGEWASQKSLQIDLANQQTLPIDGESLTSIARLILNDHDVTRGELSVAVVDDITIRELNRTYLDHDYETDVISFVLDQDPDRQWLVGQLIVSADTARRCGEQVGNNTQEELLLYVIHGTLHLVGFDDKEPEPERAMRAAERRYLGQLGIDHRGFEIAPNDSGRP